MEFQIISFKSNGNALPVFSLKASFFGLMVQGEVVGYFTTIERVKRAKLNLEGYSAEKLAA